MQDRQAGSLTGTRTPAFIVMAAIGLFCGSALAQGGLGGPRNDSGSPPNGPSPSPINPAAAISTQDFFNGSVAHGEVRPGSIPLSFKDAISMALRNNLGLLLQSDASLAARSQKWKELSDLLPNVRAAISENVSQVNLAAIGLRSNLPGFPTVVGPFGSFDARFFLKQTLFDLNVINRVRGASENEKAAHLDYKNARETVVLATGNAYLQVLAGAARVDVAQAQVTTAQALYSKAADQQNAGVIPAIDSLRARVQLQTRQQQLIVARNDFAKQKLSLARIIGLPVGQEFTLADKAPYSALTPMGLEESLQRAYAYRSDYLAAVQQVRAAERFRRAATYQHLPSLSFSGDYGASGVTPGDSHGVMDVAGTLNIPIFAGGKTHSDVLQAEATLRQSRQQVDNLRGQIEFEIRSALLDLTAADQQVQVAQSSVALANQTLEQARDRFLAGVTDNLEVVQAQESVAGANESYISSLYAHNLAKIELARAIGYAEEGVKQYLGMGK
ncbi:MAG: TolC family protein [Acidobacteria bacterium]|nr:MAG: TolC family protein [Acidobacteriota bacterium]